MTPFLAQMAALAAGSVLILGIALLVITDRGDRG